MAPSEDSSTLPSKADITKKIGQALSERRQARGISVDKVCQATKIRSIYIKALEQGQWDQLPGEVYVRGFVTRYGQYLGLKTDDLLAPYFESVQQAKENTSGTKMPLGKPDFSKSGLVWAGVALALIVGLTQVMKSNHHASPEKPAAQPVQPVASLPPAPKVAEPQAPSQHEISIFSPLPLWLNIKSDTRSFEGFIPQGSTWTWKGQGKFGIRLGHTQEVIMIFDGHPVALSESKKRLSLPNED